MALSEWMRQRFDRLPREAQDGVLGEIYEALLWRGWDAGGGIVPGGHATQAIQNVVAIFQRHGMEFEEYT